MSLPILKTRRLVLRSLEMGDAPAVADLCGRDFEVARWLTSSTWPYEEGQAEAFVQSLQGINPLQQEAVFGITLGGVLIGLVSIQAPGDLEPAPQLPSLGYWLGRAFHGFGYGREAVETALAWGFDAHDCAAIGARVFEENGPSRNLLRKTGFHPIGTTERHSRILDGKVSNVVLQLDRDDFFAARRRAA